MKPLLLFRGVVVRGVDAGGGCRVGVHACSCSISGGALVSGADVGSFPFVFFVALGVVVVVVRVGGVLVVVGVGVGVAVDGFHAVYLPSEGVDGGAHAADLSPKVFHCFLGLARGLGYGSWHVFYDP